MLQPASFAGLINFYVSGKATETMPEAFCHFALSDSAGLPDDRRTHDSLKKLGDCTNTSQSLLNVDREAEFLVRE